MLKIWVQDPKTKELSVSLTLLLVSVVLFIGLGILEVLGKIKNVGVFEQFMYTMTGLYAGRKIDFNKFLEKKNGSKVNEEK